MGSARAALLANDLEVLDPQTANVELVHHQVLDPRSADRETTDRQDTNRRTTDRDSADSEGAAKARPAHLGASWRFEARRRGLVSRVAGFQAPALRRD